MERSEKMIRNNIKLYIGIFIGLMIAGITVVCAQVYCKASEVSYTPTDSSFSAKTVSEALNKLYNRSNYLDEINTNKSSYGTFHATTTKQTIEVGFKPSKITMIIPKNESNSTAFIIYDSRISTKNIYVLSYNQFTSISDTTIIEMPWEYFSITDTGFTYQSASIDSNGQTYWYAIK